MGYVDGTDGEEWARMMGNDDSDDAGVVRLSVSPGSHQAYALYVSRFNPYSCLL